MINHNEALKVATDFIRQTQGKVRSENVVINDAVTIEEPFGWVFSWNDRRYLETGDIKYALYGNIPVVVIRTTGRTLYLPWIPGKYITDIIREFAYSIQNE